MEHDSIKDISPHVPQVADHAFAVEDMHAVVPKATGSDAVPSTRPWLQVYCRLLIGLHLFFVYALSIGPMFWLWFDAQYIDGSPLLKVFYQPLLWACQFKPIGDAVNWYINLWIL